LLLFLRHVGVNIVGIQATYDREHMDMRVKLCVDRILDEVYLCSQA